MREYQRNSDGERKPAGRFGGRSGRSEGRFGRDSDRSSRRPPEMHKVVCDKCGKDCTVPFKPTSNKPVYCSDCFRKNDNSFAKAGSEPRERSNYSASAEDLSKINQKLDKIMQALKIE